MDDSIKELRKKVEQLDIRETLDIISDSEHIINGDYRDIAVKLDQMGLSFNIMDVLNYIKHTPVGSGVYGIILGEKEFNLWHGNTRKFSLTRIK